MTPGQQVGIRQREMLEKMIRYGGGVYLPSWRLGHKDRLILESLCKRGDVVLVKQHHEQLYMTASKAREATRDGR